MKRRVFLKGARATAAFGALRNLPGEDSATRPEETRKTEESTGEAKTMKHKCKITVLRKECYRDLQEEHLADPKSGPCPFFEEGQEFLLEGDDFFRMMHGKFCAEAWDAISRYVYAALQGGSIMRGWTNDERKMIACCNDGTRPVIFKIERIDIPETETARERNP